MIHGRNLILSINGAAIAGAKGCTVDRDTDTIEVCSPTDGAARTYIPGTTGWSASANGLYATMTNADILRIIWRKYQRGVTTPITVQYTTGNQTEMGSAILTSLQESGEVGGLMKFSIKLQGTGKLKAETYAKISMRAVTSAGHVNTDKYLDFESQYEYVQQKGNDICTVTLNAGVYDIEADNAMVLLENVLETTVRGNILREIDMEQSEYMRIYEGRYTLTKSVVAVANSEDRPTIVRVQIS